MSLSQLMKILLPPSSPVGAGDPQSWKQIESELGLKLPLDYKDRFEQ
jgi:hypothetical protein